MHTEDLNGGWGFVHTHEKVMKINTKATNNGAAVYSSVASKYKYY